jgi:hypothetical protein
MRTTTTLATAMTTLAITGALVVPVSSVAQAKDGDGRIIRTGSCSGSADWKLKAKRDDGRLEVEWEVDSNTSGQTWQVRIFDNGDRVVKTRQTTQPPSGSFDVERKIANRSGSDHLVARARDVSSGQTCEGTLTF